VLLLGLPCQATSVAEYSQALRSHALRLWRRRRCARGARSARFGLS